MATIESVESVDAWRRQLRAMSREELIGQQICQRGAKHAITMLIEAGVTEANAQQMLANLKEGLCTIHEIANERGIDLVGYS